MTSKGIVQAFETSDSSAIQQFFKKNSGKINEKDKFTPLHYAVKFHCTPQVFSTLIDLKANPNETNGNTPIMYLMMENLDIDILKILLKGDINFSIKNFDYDYFDYIFKMDLEEKVFELFFDARTKTTLENQPEFASLLEKAIKHERSESILDLIYKSLKKPANEYKSYIVNFDNTLLHYAVHYNAPINFVKTLLSGFDPNVLNDETPFHFAVANGASLELLKLLIDAGADTSLTNGIGAISFAIQNDSEEIVKLLYDSGTEIKISDHEFIDLIAKSKIEIIKLLLEHKANPNGTRDAWGKHQSPLTQAITRGYDFVKLLLENGADPNLPGESFAIHHAATSRNKDIISLLLIHGANSMSLDGNSPLCTLLENPYEIVGALEVLLDSGVDVNHINNSGKKPLGIFLSRVQRNMSPSQMQVLHHLLSYGADPEDLTDFLNYEPIKQIYDKITALPKSIMGIYERKEGCDIEFPFFEKQYNLHKQFLYARIGKDLTDNLKAILTEFSEKQVATFIAWIYGKCLPSENYQEMKEMMVQLGINDFYLHTGAKGVGEAFAKMYEDKDSMDFTIIVDGKEILAHKIILMARSDLYRGMFVSVQDDSNKVNDYSGKSFEAVNSVVKFLYTNLLDEKLSNKVIQELSDAEDYYQIINSNLKEQLPKKK
ncbi:hypothetical protein M0811_13079 [Anaeramoeba ignava]|uniref:BTB domain-containing protein n=1 Tax=Anaeramoeba ignava TaxID=1746090 RepID=A0A9Q0R5M8_ANAIG|nr:hypothetical protein M0811_13079 [Anaeramoeba ignava]